MYAMQYEITLPADYDMRIIHERVRTKGALLDDLPGLGFKAYGIRERGTDGSTLNQYCPFYVWADTSAMSRFLWGGGGFGGIIASFGRPRVQHWTGISFTTGPAFDATPSLAVKNTRPIGCEEDPEAAVHEALERAAATARLPEVHSITVAVDPFRWQLLEYGLFRDEAPRTDAPRYRVLHLSAPQPELLTAGTALSSAAAEAVRR
jgi:hypothetical protein